MQKLVLIGAVSLAVGIAGATAVLRSGGPEAPTVPRSAPAQNTGAATLETRRAALESAVTAEREARQLLEEEMLALYDEIDTLRAGAADSGDEQPASGTAPAIALDAESRPRFRQRFDESRSGEDRSAALVEAGFSAERAAWIQQREDELRIEAMQARFEAQRAGDMQAMFSSGLSSQSQLRSELGDAEYERYLEAYGRPTTVQVGTVLESSPGQQAGLQRGDEIVRYDGQRVFSYSDINTLQLQGAPGEDVVVDILRDGLTVQVVMPRGPIGIEARRFMRR